MEVENIYWSNIESKYEEDSMYENIDAPQWIDLSSPTQPVDGDDTWFCNPDCKHYKHSEDFSESTPSLKVVKLIRSVTISEILPLRDRKNRNVKPKVKETNGSAAEIPSAQCLGTKATNASHKFRENNENQDPNIFTSPFNANLSAEKKKEIDNKYANSGKHSRKRGLRSTFSARNLVAGRKVVNQITEFCADLKKLARNVLKKGSSEKVSGGV